MLKRSASVVLVGRPNVGKSTLFNRITGSRRAIVTPTPGTTRDVIRQTAEWRGVQFELVDTGGLFGASEDPLHELVIAHGRRAIAEADLVVFLVDGRDGKVSADEEIAAVLREAGAPVVLAVNKVDDRRAEGGVLDFYQMGFEPVVEIAAEHGRGVGDLLDEVVRHLPDAARARGASAWNDAAEPAAAPVGGVPAETRVAIVGRPNVGKSSLVNRLLREERVLVDEVPGTTRDAVDAALRWHRKVFRIVDTAGIRRPGRVATSGQVEAVSVVLARRAVAQADVAVVVIDATEGLTDQDAAIAGEAEKAGCGIVVAVNKWDLTKGRGDDYARSFDDKLRFSVKFLDYAPLVHISALTGERTGRLLEVIERVAAARRTRVPTGELNRFVEKVTAAHQPASRSKRAVRVLYAVQAGVAPPSFVIFMNVATTLHFSYERYLVNQIREAFGFLGSPIRIQVRARRRRTR